MQILFASHWKPPLSSFYRALSLSLSLSLSFFVYSHCLSRCVSLNDKSNKTLPFSHRALSKRDDVILSSAFVLYTTGRDTLLHTVYLTVPQPVCFLCFYPLVCFFPLCGCLLLLFFAGFNVFLSYCIKSSVSLDEQRICLFSCHLFGMELRQTQLYYCLFGFWVEESFCCELGLPSPHTAGRCLFIQFRFSGSSHKMRKRTFQDGWWHAGEQDILQMSDFRLKCIHWMVECIVQRV